MPAAIDLRGQKFGRLTPLATAHVQLSSGRQMPGWTCRCDCGNEVVVQGHHLRGGATVSCGCFSREQASFRHRVHGESHSRPYRVWRQMINRCHLSSSDKHEWYGARGIKVCDRWRFGENGVSGYECWLADMGPKPSPKHTVERIDNDGDYEPDNCCWATQQEQMRNTRVSTGNYVPEVAG